MNLSNNILFPLPDLDLILVQGGVFQMGLLEEDPDSFGDEQPVHTVNVPSFYMAKFPTTQRLWKAVMQSEQYPSYFQGEKRPKSNASWDDVQEFVNVLSKIPEIQSLLNEINIVGAKFRLPSDAEWEYAARGGLKSEGFKYVGSNKIKEVGWYDHNSQSETKPVGLKYSNELGIFDMSGNIWEWCEDDWHDNYFGAPVNGKPWIGKPKRGINKVCRGGCCFNLPPRCRVSCRGKSLKNVRLSYLGFRLALTVAEESKQ